MKNEDAIANEVAVANCGKLRNEISLAASEINCAIKYSCRNVKCVSYIAAIFYFSSVFPSMKFVF